MRVQDAVVTFLSYAKQRQKRPLIKEAFKLKNQIGLEIGGPTRFFGLKGGIPVYLVAERVDNVNFGTHTFFGNYQAGNTYHYHEGKTGKQFISEATDLREIADNTYDFVLSSHSLEHTANPIKALTEWIRILKRSGKLVLILPDKRHTFDHYRKYTSFSHLLEDYHNNTLEHDTTHMEEILSTFDENKMGVTLVDFEKLISDNFTNRAAHHHVFSQEVVKSMLEFVGFTVEFQYETEPFHLITIAKK